MGWFYNDSLTVLVQSAGHLDQGVWIDGDTTESTPIACDVQPASRDEVFKDYGYYIDCSFRVFCDPDSKLDVGVTVNYGGKKYKIAKLVNWRTFYEFFMDEA